MGAAISAQKIALESLGDGNIRREDYENRLRIFEQGLLHPEESSTEMSASDTHFSMSHDSGLQFNNITEVLEFVTETRRRICEE